MIDKTAAKARTQLLKQLREEHNETVAITQERLKEQKAIRKVLNQVMAEKAQTIPEIAAAADMPSNEVLWHVTAMKKYGLVVETGQSGDYYLYELAKESSE